MCRIFGRFGADTSPGRLARVAQRQRHGGPDDQQVLTGDRWALGINRLAVLNPAGGRQPYRGDRVAAVFNGELYNHHELRTRLAARGRHVPDPCDGAVIPALFEEFGEAFVDLLDGMYAIAIVDPRRSPVLFLATDPAGMKPIYYRHNPQSGVVEFASELPALLEFGDDRPAHRPLALDEYLTTKAGFGPDTFFEGIQIAPPGARLRVEQDRSTAPRQWLAAHVDAPADSTAPQDFSGAKLRQLLENEIDHMMAADVPLCSIVSGGLDSSIVTALAATQLPRLDTFTIGYQGNWPHDETQFAQELAERYGTTHHEVRLDPDEIPELLLRTVAHLGQPNADPITVSTLALFRAVKSAGCTVALTGDAADELFGGYDRIAVAAAAGAGPDWVPRYVDSLAAIPLAARRRLYTDDYKELVDAEPNVRDALINQMSGPGPRLPRVLAVERMRRLPAYHLRRVDHLSMACAVETRIPFCQRAIVDFAMRSPEDAKIDGNRRKRVLYDAAEGLVPPAIVARPKQPFTLPIVSMLAPGTPLMAFACDLLAPAAVRRRGALEPAAVTALIKRQAQEPSTESALAVWSLLVHAAWTDSALASSQVAA